MSSDAKFAAVGAAFGAACSTWHSDGRLSGSFHSHRARSSLDQDMHGGYTIALPYPPGLQGGLVDAADDALAADDGEDVSGTGAGTARQLQQQSSFQEGNNMLWFV
jgi:hypothetical protein